MGPCSTGTGVLQYLVLVPVPGVVTGGTGTGGQWLPAGGPYWGPGPGCWVSLRYVHKGYLHPEKGSPGRWRFKCHRCGMATTLLDFVREYAAHLLLPTTEVLEVPSQESVDGCGDEERVTRLPPQKGISDALWRSRHLPRHLYRGNRRILSDEHQVHDE